MTSGKKKKAVDYKVILFLSKHFVSVVFFEIKSV